MFFTKFSQSFHEVFTEFSQRFSQRFSQWFSQTVILMNQRALFLHAQYPLHPSIRLETIVKGSRDRKPAKLPWLVASPKWSSESVWFGWMFANLKHNVRKRKTQKQISQQWLCRPAGATVVDLCRVGGVSGEAWWHCSKARGPGSTPHITISF